MTKLTKRVHRVTERAPSSRHFTFYAFPPESLTLARPLVSRPHQVWTNFRAANPEAEPGKVAMLASTVSSKLLAAMAEAEGFRFEETLTGFKWLGNRAKQLEAEGYTVLFAFEEAIGFMFPQVRAAEKQSILNDNIKIQIKHNQRGLRGGYRLHVSAGESRRKQQKIDTGCYQYA